ncbi:MAG: EAL domain-containing protein [Sideroxyarcus sp.]|nr:EAL domain-containing protein [Sideroxyarcus sp.]
MTLFRQLFWGTSIAFLLILIATETIYIRNAHKYLQEQLASHSQNAATSLGLVLPAAMAEGDPIRAEVTVNAMFDRGYYQSIRVLNIRGETVVLKTLPVAPADVPQWFVNLLPLETPSAESLVSQGWRQLGRVVVSSHPNFAYKQLWRTLLEATLGLALLYMLVLFSLHKFLLRILKPLRAIKEAAQAISGRDFKIIESIPDEPELRSVVNEINLMSNKLRGIIEHEVQQAIRFRDEACKDIRSGLESRRGFEEYVKALLEDRNNLGSGAMYMLQFADFEGYNIRHGFREGDALLKDIALALQSIWPTRDLLRSRVNGATFVIVVPNISRNEAEQLGNELMVAVNAVFAALRDEIPVSFGCGAVYFSDQPVTMNALLAQCDMAMLQSLSNGNRLCVLQNLTGDDQSKGSLHWKQLIMDAIAAQRVRLFAQPVMDIRNKQQLQIEIFGRLQQENGELVPAEQFIPMANRHGLTPAFDLAILKKLFGGMANGMITDQEVAINLSVYSIRDALLLDWLRSAMRADPLLAKRLIFEFTEFGIVQDRVGVEIFVTEMRKLGANFAVDNFGLHQSAFEYLQTLKPRYLKLSQAYIRDLQSSHKHQLFISSVVMIARQLDIRVIVLGIEDVAMLELATHLGVDGYQGYLTGKLSGLD